MARSMADPENRRPIQSRNTRWAEAVARLLVRLDVRPNTISLFGMAAAVAAGGALYSTQVTTGAGQRALWLLAALLCQVRLLCNLFDGMVAVGRGIASPKGELYNEVPDRISDAAVLVGLGYASGGAVALGYVAAITAVFVAYVRAMAKSIGAPNDFCGPMAKPHRMAVVIVVAVYMAVAPPSWRLSWGEPTVALAVIIVGGVVTASRRLMRAARHLEGVAR